MRPTNLKFRSPKEQTPGPYFPQMTNMGNKLLDFNKQHKASFLRSQRFEWYGKPTKIGPGSYTHSAKRFEGAPIYKPLHASPKLSKDSYTYIGDCIVPQPQLKRRRKNLSKSKSRSIAKSKSFKSVASKSTTSLSSLSTKFQRNARKSLDSIESYLNQLA